MSARGVWRARLLTHPIVEWAGRLVRVPAQVGARIPPLPVWATLPALRSAVAERLDDPPPLPATTLAVVVAGALWLALEQALRALPVAAVLALDVSVIVVLVAISALVGLAVRARATMRGEMAVDTQLALVILLVAFLLPAGMLLCYALTALCSGAVVALAWGVWATACFLAVLIQLALLAGAVVAFSVGTDLVDVWGGLGAAAIYLIIVAGLGYLITDRALAAFDGSIVVWTFAFKRLVPDWLFLFVALRRGYEWLDHGRLVTIYLSVPLGTGAGLATALALRWTRQQLMTNVALRPHLPMGATPLPDHVPFVDRRLLAPLVVYSLVGWAIVVVWRIA